MYLKTQSMLMVLSREVMEPLATTALLEEVCHCGGWSLAVSSYAQDLPSMGETVLFWLPSDQDIDLYASSLAPCLPVCCHASCLDDNGLNL